MHCEFFVPGLPKPGGSKTPTVVRRKGGAIVMNEKGNPVITVRDACKGVREWRAVVADAASRAIQRPIHGPIRLDVEFRMPRPQGHYRTGKYAGQKRENAPRWHTVKPDRTKLLRALEDAMKGIAWIDDTQVVCGNVVKVYADETCGALVRISEANANEAAAHA